MRSVVLGLVLLAGAMGAAAVLSAREARCQGVYCNAIPCLDRSVCGPGCVCLRRGVEFGQCVSLQAR